MASARFTHERVGYPLTRVEAFIPNYRSRGDQGFYWHNVLSGLLTTCEWLDEKAGFSRTPAAQFSFDHIGVELVHPTAPNLAGFRRG